MPAARVAFRATDAGALINDLPRAGAAKKRTKVLTTAVVESRQPLSIRT